MRRSGCWTAASRVCQQLRFAGQGGITYDLRQIDGPSGNSYEGVFVDRQRKSVFIAVHDITRDLAPQSFAQLEGQLKALGLARAKGDVRTKFYVTSLEQLGNAGDAVGAFYRDALGVWRERRDEAGSD